MVPTAELSSSFLRSSTSHWCPHTSTLPVLSCACSLDAQHPAALPRVATALRLLCHATRTREPALPMPEPLHPFALRVHAAPSSNSSWTQVHALNRLPPPVCGTMCPSRLSTSLGPAPARPPVRLFASFGRCCPSSHGREGGFSPGWRGV
jgi:hypothetical protein